MTNIFIKKLTSTATVPTYGSDSAAGMDLYADENTVVPAQGKALISTGIAVAIEPDTYLRIAPRSGLANKYSIDVLAGVIDEDYRGEIKVILFNHGSMPFTVNRGDRIAQAINEVITRPMTQEVTELPATLRGADGFGSTGV